jgi:hypothetical protein
MRADFTRRALRAVFALVAAILGVGVLWPPASAPAAPSESALRAAVLQRARASRPAVDRVRRDPTPLERRFGVVIDSLSTTAGGYMLDLRLRVLEPVAAAPLLARRLRPRVVTADGSALTVPVAPKLGALRQTAAAAKADGRYFALFANPGQRVRRGERVEVELGELRVEGVVVE